MRYHFVFHALSRGGTQKFLLGMSVLSWEGMRLEEWILIAKTLQLIEPVLSASTCLHRPRQFGPNEVQPVWKTLRVCLPTE